MSIITEQSKHFYEFDKSYFVFEQGEKFHIYMSRNFVTALGYCFKKFFSSEWSECQFDLYGKNFCVLVKTDEKQSIEAKISEIAHKATAHKDEVNTVDRGQTTPRQEETEQIEPVITIKDSEESKTPTLNLAAVKECNGDVRKLPEEQKRALANLVAKWTFHLQEGEGSTIAELADLWQVKEAEIEALWHLSSSGYSNDSYNPKIFIERMRSSFDSSISELPFYVFPDVMRPDPLPQLDLSEYNASEGVVFDALTIDQQWAVKGVVEKWNTLEFLNQKGKDAHVTLRDLSFLAPEKALRDLFYCYQIFPSENHTYPVDLMEKVFADLNEEIEKPRPTRFGMGHQPGVRTLWKRAPTVPSWQLKDLSMYLAVRESALALFLRGKEVYPSEQGDFSHMEIQKAITSATNREFNSCLEANRTQDRSRRWFIT